jgi:ABC-type glycerol-3-phosphate transport system permease component
LPGAFRFVAAPFGGVHQAWVDRLEPVEEPRDRSPVTEHHRRGGYGGPAGMFQLPFATFMMRTSFEAVPRELEEAALVDGCGTFGALVRVLPAAVRPGLVTVGLFAFLASWNDFLAPLILLNDGSKFTLPVAVANLTNGTFSGFVQSGVMIMAIPCLILFLLLQRHYVRGFVAGALGGQAEARFHLL